MLNKFQRTSEFVVPRTNLGRMAMARFLPVSNEKVLRQTHYAFSRGTWKNKKESMGAIKGRDFSMIHLSEEERS